MTTFFGFALFTEFVEMAVVSYFSNLQNLRKASRRIWQGPGSKLFAFVLPEDRFAGHHIKETPRYQHVHVSNEVPKPHFICAFVSRTIINAGAKRPRLSCRLDTNVSTHQGRGRTEILTAACETICMPEDMSRSVKHAAVELVVRYLGCKTTGDSGCFCAFATLPTAFSVLLSVT